MPRGRPRKAWHWPEEAHSGFLLPRPGCLGSEARPGLLRFLGTSKGSRKVSAQIQFFY